jgi:hypothetical protein
MTTIDSQNIVVLGLFYLILIRESLVILQSMMERQTNWMKLLK